MLAADAYTGIPLLVSVWGNDLTLHAPSTSMMDHYTRWTMSVADALHADCYRDIRLAKQWGFESSKPTLVIPGNGGIHMDIFYPPSKPVDEPIVFNPRGFRAYVRNDVFFHAIPLVLKKYPTAKFVCASMANEPQALQWMEKLNIRESVELLPALPHFQMADVFRRAPDRYLAEHSRWHTEFLARRHGLRMFSHRGKFRFDSRMDHQRQEWHSH